MIQNTVRKGELSVMSKKKKKLIRGRLSAKGPRLKSYDDLKKKCASWFIKI